ncbi:MAG: AMP-binding protein [Firmicutes bacterium]|nr:AMP-binding protein [Bacillota bacterium]
MSQNIARERVMHRLLERQAEKYGQRTYMYFEDKKFSYKDLNDFASRVARGLQDLGIAKGDKVAVVMENCPEYIFLMFALSKLGAVEVPINVFHKGEIMNYMVDHSDCSIVVMQVQYIDRLESILQKSNKIKAVVLMESSGEDQKSGVTNATVAAVKERIASFGKKALGWPELMGNDGNYQKADVIWSDPLLLLYTSGTTGLSKGVLLPQNLFYSMAERFCNWVLEGNLGEDDCIYVPSPLFHAHAWHAGINLALLKGARILLRRRFSASAHWDDIRRFNCTYSAAGGPRLPILLAAEPSPNDADNPLRVILGGPASEKICNAFEPRFGVKVLEFYGSTELGAPAMNTVSNRKIGSCGRMLPDFLFKIADDDGAEVGVNQPGEFLVRVKQPYAMMLEYYKMPEKTVEAWRDLWFHTGDRVRVDEDGYIHFVDRKKDSIRRRGENISSFEVERVINSHPAVLESAAYGVESEFTDDDEVMVSLVLKPGQTLSPEELIAHCEGEMAYFMVPRYVRFVKELPKNAVNRVEKFKLREEGVTSDTWDREKSGYKLKR